MNQVFLHLLNRSLTAGWLVLAVLVLRLLLKRAPKWVSVLLWGLVALRLAIPISLESFFSLIPNPQTVPMDIEMAETPQLNTGFTVINEVVNPILNQTATPAVGASVNPMQVVVGVLANLWLLGVLGMLLYTGISYFRLRHSLRTAVRLRDNIWRSENVPSPFVLGILKPKIYLPFRMHKQDIAYVVAHEKAHIRRLDHLWKPFGFLLLTVYWFHPLLWIAYVLLCRDIELACDEAVIRVLGNEQRANYTQSLLSCSVNRRRLIACPLAFGEVGVKKRIRSVMDYRKPAFWVIVVSLLVCAVVAVCFLTDPVTIHAQSFPMTGNNVAHLEPEKIVSDVKTLHKLSADTELYTNENTPILRLSSDFTWEDIEFIQIFYTEKERTQKALVGFHDGKYSIDEPMKWPDEAVKYEFLDLLEAMKYLPQDIIKEYAPDADVYNVCLSTYGTPANYGKNGIYYSYRHAGVNVVGPWSIHLEIQPMFQTGENTWSSNGTEPLHAFYYRPFHPDGETIAMEDTTEIYENRDLGIRLALPASWKGKYAIGPNPNYPGNMIIETWWGGVLCYMMEYDLAEWIAAGEGELSPVDNRELGRTEDTVWVLYFDSSVQFDPYDAEQINTYGEMRNDLYRIGFEAID